MTQIEAVGRLSGAALSAARVLKSVAQSKNADFEFLFRVAQRESSLNPDAKANTSTATGLFQFLEDTWLEAIEKHGAAVGLGADAEKIEFVNGRYRVTSNEEREAILAKRSDPEFASKIAVETFRSIGENLTRKIGRSPSRSELYLAHFLGTNGASQMLNADHSASARDIAPSAARANMSLFFENGSPVSVGKFLEKISASFEFAVPENVKIRQSELQAKPTGQAENPPHTDFPNATTYFNRNSKHSFATALPASLIREVLLFDALSVVTSDPATTEKEKSNLR